MQHYCRAQADTLVAYPGGDAALADFVKARLVTTKAALAADISGDVTLQFIVDENGRAGDINVVKRLGYGCDEQAILVLRQMPIWQPEVVSGKRIKAQLQQTFHFDTGMRAAAGSGIAAGSGTATSATHVGGVLVDRSLLPAAPLQFGDQPEDLQIYIGRNFVYPAGVSQNVAGTIVIKFRVTPEGRTDNIQLVAGLGEAFDGEAIRVIKNMPSWQPRLVNFRPVADYKELAIGFKKKKAWLQ